MKNLLLIAVSATFFFAGCSYDPPAPIQVKRMDREIDYLADVKPILDRRCVVCHSCYNSPCQLKLSSYEGADRGASKELVYKAERLRAQPPTRLFMDAETTAEWRKKSFFSVTGNTAPEGFNNTTMAHLLRAKMRSPLSPGEYRPETDLLSCPKNGEEVAEFIDNHPERGMPYGFPALTTKEYETLLHWLQQGAHGPNEAEQKKLVSPSPAALEEIGKWENLLNREEPKYRLTARYLYEHLFIAHLHFPSAPNAFYELVRSKTPSPEKIEVIATVRPFDDPGVEKFYYRIRKIHSTIVHKTHIVFEMDDEQYEQITRLFIGTPWLEEPHLMDYDEVRSANPFLTYAQIPPESRYRFLLHNSEYITRTFIRGPVCKGQIALNVINDHFWTMFLDPKSDLSVQHPEFLIREAKNLSMPIEKGSSMGVFSTFSDRYRERYLAYMRDKGEFYQRFGVGTSLKDIWRGTQADDAPVLTVYRHFDSATVRKGVLGQLPKTMWVMDYPQFERLYYALVAGFDVFGNLSHQTNVRRYMDFLRIEGEATFLTFLPQKERVKTFRSWYIGDDAAEDIKGIAPNYVSNIRYSGPHYKQEFIEQVVDKHLLKETAIAFDHNYLHLGEKVPDVLPEHYDSEADYLQALRVVARPGTAFMKVINGYNANLALVRVVRKEGADLVYSIVINRWHDNVNALFDEDDRLDPSKDTADFIKGSVGSYPNFFMVVKEEELPDFFDLLEHYEETPAYEARLLRYGVARNDLDFWKHYDWFQEHFYKAEPIQSGMYDLNRYYFRAW
ncbi:fatty acid cis/trans isomerase [Sulfurimonas sp. HSL3-7]|uniref:fatty acid cis/trans isomerase n=1 Tax=Sulfonitrofixus jiaomeiensis TaxID=3131938 RepID=UPI0031F7D02B